MRYEDEEFVTVTAFGRQIHETLPDAFWPADVQALLAEEHLAAWTPIARQATGFSASLRHYLALQPDTEVWSISGRTMTTLDDIAAALESTVPCGPISPTIDGPRGITEALRHRAGSGYGSLARFRYVLWTDVDEMLERDPDTFGALADALIGVAAESEYASDELLMIHRNVFVGGEALGEYASDPRGQLRRWRRDTPGQRPFWECVTQLPAPPVNVRRVERLLQGGAI